MVIWLLVGPVEGAKVQKTNPICEAAHRWVSVEGNCCASSEEREGRVCPGLYPGGQGSASLDLDGNG